MHGVPVILRTLKGSVRAWWDDDCTRLGASLAFFTLFAIAPVLIMAIAIAGFAFGAEAVRGEIVGQIDHLVGREGAVALQALLEGASQKRSGVVATVLGALTFLLTSTGAFLELQVAFNTIWRVKPRPGTQIKAFVIDRLRSFGLVVAIGFLLLVSLTVTAALAALNAWLFSVSPTDAYLWTIVNTLVSIVVTTG
ncbi:MAG: YhjD/YihY/BrkB family envelope integrity protein, partial [Vicinamibacterales bacterium]